ncbi:MAG TPA: hypothetical protein VJ799_11660, partial [Nitrososphaeraceae archaeon]|nr:hypothetical protein [Nitrososphaeraceae archaeon]
FVLLSFSFDITIASFANTFWNLSSISARIVLYPAHISPVTSISLNLQLPLFLQMQRELKDIYILSNTCFQKH